LLKNVALASETRASVCGLQARYSKKRVYVQTDSQPPKKA
jgi:hypothetical protein